MSLLRALDGTTCTNAVSNIAIRPLLAFLYPALPPMTTHRRFHRRAASHPAPRSPLASPAMDSIFIQALVRAGSCQHHQRHVCTSRDGNFSIHKYHRTRGKSAVYPQRQFKTKTQVRGPFARVRQFAQDELKALVDYYGIEFDTRPEEEPPDAGLLIWNTGSDHQPWPPKDLSTPEVIRELETLLESKTPSHEAVFDCYKRLPAPGVAYLALPTIRELLHTLSVVERPDIAAMQRYLSIMDDMKHARIHAIKSEWTSAIRLAGRCVRQISSVQVQAALQQWRDMEKRAGVKGGVVTMQVLFDIAVKSGHYELAETFLKEMRARHLRFHRHFRVSLIYYYGVMRDGEAVRRAYHDLVTAGDIVDTVVMNAVIAALFRAGEPAAAEHVFERMKRLNASKENPRHVPRYWRERRSLGLQLTYEVRNVPTEDEEKRKSLQEQAPIAPDPRTYGLLLRYHAATAGNVDRVLELLREMELNQIPIEGTIFVVILYGFNSYGGVRYSSWTRDKLEDVWQSYIHSVREGVPNTWFSSMSVIVALKAFKKCTDSKRTMQAWEEVRQIWHPDPAELQRVLKVLRRLVPEHSFFNANMVP